MRLWMRATVDDRDNLGLLHSFWSALIRNPHHQVRFPLAQNVEKCSKWTSPMLKIEYTFLPYDVVSRRFLSFDKWQFFTIGTTHCSIFKHSHSKIPWNSRICLYGVSNGLVMSFVNILLDFDFKTTNTDLIMNNLRDLLKIDHPFELKMKFLLSASFFLSSEFILQLKV